MKKSLVEQSLWAAAYCQVSIDSDEQLGSLESEIEFYTNYIRKQFNWTLAGIYLDNASGVRFEKRSAISRIKDYMKGKIDLILVKSQPI